MTEFTRPGRLPSPLLNWLSDFVSTHLGLHFAPQRWSDLQRGVDAAAAELGFSDTHACIAWLASAPPTRRQIEILAGHLTVGETYFFRESQSFQVLEQHVLPQLAAARRAGSPRLRIWSAGCCTGEEPYSLAIALTRALPELTERDVSILATDINPRFLRRAAQGVFGEWSFRDVPAGIKSRYFDLNADGRYSVAPRVRRLVRFAALNLAEDPYPSAFNDTAALDVIFCRNVLMYLSAEQARRIAGQLARCLAEGGWLFVGAAEGSPVLFADLLSRTFPEVNVYRKPGGAEALPKISAARAIESERERPVAEGAASAELQKIDMPSADAGEPEILARRARAHADRGELSEGLAWCDKAITAGKLDPRFHYLRAMILLERGQGSEAAAPLRRAVFLDPGFVMAHFALGRLMQRQGKFNQAARHFDQVRRLLGDCRAAQVLPESDGLTAGRLMEIIEPVLQAEPA
ncbi:MAG TPA: CheR family methyltransferase [Phycisphaerae bacterium]|jgi:chemotaxis protein methyltransferase CheR